MCAFTMGVLERLVLSNKDSFMKEAKSIQLIDFSLSLIKNQNNFIMGGEFIGKVIIVAMGGDECVNSGCNDADQFFHFIKHARSIETACRHIISSGDPNQVLQRLLCLLTPEYWQK